MLCMIYKIFTLLWLGRECQHAPPAKEIRKFPKDFKCLWGVAVARKGEEKLKESCVTVPYLAYFFCPCWAIMMDADVVYFTSRVFPAPPLRGCVGVGNTIRAAPDGFYFN